MRILIITAVFPPEPVVSATISFDLATELAKGNEVTVLCPPPTRPLGYKLTSSFTGEQGFKKVQMNSFTCPESRLFGRLRESYSFGKKCAHFITRNAEIIDIIYFNAWPLFSQFLVANTAKKLGIPYVVHVQDIYPETIINPRKLLYKIPYFCLLQLDRFVLSKANSVVTISEYMRNYLKSTRKLNNAIKVVHNWTDQQPSVVIKPGNKQNKAFSFMFLGSLSPTAGIDNLIIGFTRANLPMAKLIVAGAGSDKQSLENLAATFPESDIQFIDAPKEDVPHLQQSADVLLLSLKSGSANYALPSKLTSYLFSQKPVMACVDPGSSVSILIEQAACGWICDVTNPEAIAAGFSVAFNATEATRREMGFNGRQYAEERLSKPVNLSILKQTILSYVK